VSRQGWLLVSPKEIMLLPGFGEHVRVVAYSSQKALGRRKGNWLVMRE